jgi:hypothetical protein
MDEPVRSLRQVLTPAGPRAGHCAAGGGDHFPSRQVPSTDAGDPPSMPWPGSTGWQESPLAHPSPALHGLPRPRAHPAVASRMATPHVTASFRTARASAPDAFPSRMVRSGSFVGVLRALSVAGPKAPSGAPEDVSAVRKGMDARQRSRAPTGFADGVNLPEGQVRVAGKGLAGVLDPLRGRGSGRWCGRLDLCACAGMGAGAIGPVATPARPPNARPDLACHRFVGARPTEMHRCGPTFGRVAVAIGLLLWANQARPAAAPVHETHARAAETNMPPIRAELGRIGRRMATVGGLTRGCFVAEWGTVGRGAAQSLTALLGVPLLRWGPTEIVGGIATRGGVLGLEGLTGDSEKRADRHCRQREEAASVASACL